MYSTLTKTSFRLLRQVICRVLRQRSASFTSSSVKIESDGLVNYEKRGSGSRVVLCIPGALGSALTDFIPQLEYFGREGSGYTVVGMDPVGYGASRTKQRRVFCAEPDHFLKKDAIDGHELMLSLNCTKFSVLGWSDGGVSAIILAALFPNSVEKLVVWGSNAYVTKEDIDLFEKTRDVSNWSQRMRETMENIYGDEFQQLWSAWVDGMRDIFDKRDDGDLCLEEVKQVQCPTLIVHGAKDAMCPQFHAEYLHREIQGSKLVMIEEGKHNLHLKHAHEFNKMVDDFLNT